MKSKVVFGYSAGEVIVMEGKKVLARFTPSQAMQLSTLTDGFAYCAISANNAHQGGPSGIEMADILKAVNMVYKNSAGDVVSWNELKGHPSLGDENQEEVYYRVTKEAYTFLCSHFTDKK